MGFGTEKKVSYARPTCVLRVAQVLQQSVQLGQVVVDVLALRRGDGLLNDALLRGKRLQHNKYTVNKESLIHSAPLILLARVQLGLFIHSLMRTEHQS
jgi:hypothetical protein